MSARETVLVTGASGFLGRHVTAALLGAGYAVRGLVRPGSTPPAEGVEPAVAEDLSDRPALRRALDGAGAVVHLAARVHVMHDTAASPLAEFRRVNVEGTRALLEEAAAAGAGRFVLASSVKAVGEGGDTPWDEHTPPAPSDPYGISKLEAERVVLEEGRALGLGATVLRLPLVYGPGVRANMLRLFRMVDRGLPLPLGAVRNRRSLVFTGNVAAAVRAVLATPRTAGETFFVSDGHDLSTPELIREIARALGRPARLLPVPPALFRLGGRAGDALGRVLPIRVPLDSAAVSRLLGSLRVDSSRLARVTGSPPPFSVREGLARTAEWYRRAGSAGEEGR